MIKGVKDGLVFLLDDACPFPDLLQELRHKLEKTHQTILTGPLIHVSVKLGNRDATEAEIEQIRTAIGSRGNLLVQAVESDVPKPEPPHNRFKRLAGMVRSGQTVRHEGHLLLLGDINPGGTVVCTGDIYVLGSLRGMAHAGVDGDERSIIAAAHMRPTQLRIAGIFSRPPDEWGAGEAAMEFAYIKSGAMEIDKIQQLYRIRPDAPI